MIINSKPKQMLKRNVKKSLVLMKHVVGKSKHLRRAATLIKNVLFTNDGPIHYNVSRYAPTIAEYSHQLATAKSYRYKPLISIVMPTYNTPIEYLKKCIESVIIQSYPYWELCIADDCSTDDQVVKTIEMYAAKDERIKLVKRKKNGHISAATNSAIEIASGDFIALLDHDDIIWPNALYELVGSINANPDVDLLYSDEDKIDNDDSNHSYPFFKPDWSPEFLESCNYITHFACIRASIVSQVGGLRVGYEGAQDWDLFLRISEITDNIVHITKVIYSWRIHEESTAMDTGAKPYVYEAQNKLLHDHVSRVGEKAIIKQGVIKQHSSVEYEVVDNPTVDVLVCVKNNAMLKRALASLKKHDDYKNRQIIILADNATQYAIGKKYAKQDGSFKVCKAFAAPAEAFNIAATASSADYLVFMEGGQLVESKKWLNFLVGDAQRKGVGVVGGKTLNASKDRILRAGAATGIYGLYAPLLEDVPADNIHYLLGLYGHSRRNTLILDSGCAIVKRQTFKSVRGFDTTLDDMYFADFCLKLHELGLRHIYNPFIETVDLDNRTAGDIDMNREKAAKIKFILRWQKCIDYDPYFNPSFTRTNSRLEFK